jgi:hypothetical protein
LSSAAGVAPASYPVASIRLLAELPLTESPQPLIRLPLDFLEALDVLRTLCDIVNKRAMYRS